MARAKSFSDIIREAIEADGRNLHELYRESGVAPAVLSRFVNRKRDLNLVTAERLCRVLGLELRPVVRQKKDG